MNKKEVKEFWEKVKKTEPLKNYKTLTEKKKRLFWGRKVYKILERFGKAKEFEKKGQLAIQKENESIELTLTYLKVKVIEPNGKKASYSLNFLKGSMGTTYYNVCRGLKKILKEVNNGSKN